MRDERAALWTDASPQELAAAVTTLFILDTRHQQAALQELVRRCERYEQALRQIAYGFYDVNSSAVSDLAEAKRIATEATRRA